MNPESSWVANDAASSLLPPDLVHFGFTLTCNEFNLFRDLMIFLGTVFLTFMFTSRKYGPKTDRADVEDSSAVHETYRHNISQNPYAYYFALPEFKGETTEITGPVHVLLFRSQPNMTGDGKKLSGLMSGSLQWSPRASAHVYNEQGKHVFIAKSGKNEPTWIPDLNVFYKELEAKFAQDETDQESAPEVRRTQRERSFWLVLCPPATRTFQQCDQSSRTIVPEPT